MNTFVIILTYGNRFDFLKEAAAVLLKASVTKLVIVNNNSSPESTAHIKALHNTYPGTVHCIHLPRNTGTAKGFGTGLRYACCEPSCEFIWLLDDDNLPNADALEILKRTWSSLPDLEKDIHTCLLSFRKDRPLYRRAIMEHKPCLMLGRPNVFRAFHAADIPARFFNRFFHRENSVRAEMTARIMEIPAAPYGGMFFHKNLCGSIGLPDERFYLYVDDHEYSHRIVKNGGKILLVTDSVISDIDRSWNTRDDGFSFIRIARDKNHTRLYYSVRNRVYFEKQALVTNRVVYFANMALYSVLVILSAVVFFNSRNIRVYYRALKHGLTGRMGKHPDYVLT